MTKLLIDFCYLPNNILWFSKNIDKLSGRIIISLNFSFVGVLVVDVTYICEETNWLKLNVIWVFLITHVSMLLYLTQHPCPYVTIPYKSPMSLCYYPLHITHVPVLLSLTYLPCPFVTIPYTSPMSLCYYPLHITHVPVLLSLTYHPCPFVTIHYTSPMSLCYYSLNITNVPL